MLEKIEEIKSEALKQLAGIDNVKDLESWRVRYLGKKSPLTQILRGLSTLSIEERKSVGAAANKVKNLLDENAGQKGQSLREAHLTSEAARKAIDISLPGRPYHVGHLHPITRTIEEVCEIFRSMGFEAIEGPEVEWDYHNFEAQNIPAEHPSRDTMSTFWVDSGKDENRPLLRTHNTAVTARTLEKIVGGIIDREVSIRKIERHEDIDIPNRTAPEPAAQGGEDDEPAGLRSASLSVQASELSISRTRLHFEEEQAVAGD